MKLRDKYLLLNCNRTYIKGWLHLFTSIILLNYYLNNRNKRKLIFFILSFLISGIYHLISFDNIIYDKYISLLDYIFVLILVYIVFTYNNLYKKYNKLTHILKYILIITIMILCYQYLKLEDNYYKLFKNIYIIYLILLVMVLLPNIINNNDYIYNIIIPIIIINSVRIINIDMSYKKIWNNHDIFQILSVIYCYYFIKYLC